MLFDNGRTRVSRYCERNDIAILDTIYNGELTSSDITSAFQVIRKNFTQPVCFAVIRHGNYSVSAEALEKLIDSSQNSPEWDKAFIGSIAYVDRNDLEAMMSRFAAETYFVDKPVKSFRSEEAAYAWLVQQADAYK